MLSAETEKQVCFSPEMIFWVVISEIYIDIDNDLGGW